MSTADSVNLWQAHPTFRPLAIASTDSLIHIEFLGTPAIREQIINMGKELGRSNPIAKFNTEPKPYSSALRCDKNGAPQILAASELNHYHINFTAKSGMTREALQVIAQKFEALAKEHHCNNENGKPIIDAQAIVDKYDRAHPAELGMWL